LSDGYRNRAALLLEPPQFDDQFFVVRFLAKFIGLGKNDLALFGHDKDGPVIDSRQWFSQAQDAKLLGHSGVWPIVAQKWIFQPADRLFLPGEVAVN